MRWEDLYIREKGLSEGYVNFKFLIETLPYPYIFMVGARGIGKTYGANEYALDHDDISIWLRRTQEQCDLVSKDKFFHGKDVYEDRGRDYLCKPLTKHVYEVYRDVEIDEDGVKRPSGEPYMFNGALGTIHNIRGASNQSVDTIFYDEFIPEKHVRKMNHEGNALMGVLETFGRNRELKGIKPLKLIAMANSDDINNAVFADLNMIGAVSKQFKTGKAVYIDNERGYCVINFKNSPISEKKKDTALYKFAKGTDYGNMAIENQFGNYESRQKSYPLKALIGYARLGEITCARVKNTDIFYITTHNISGSVEFPNTDKGIECFKHTDMHKALIGMYLTDDLVFEDYESEYLFKHYLQIK